MYVAPLGLVVCSGIDYFRKKVLSIDDFYVKFGLSTDDFYETVHFLVPCLILILFKFKRLINNL